MKMLAGIGINWILEKKYYGNEKHKNGISKKPVSKHNW
jgi:hypothetical protein